MKCLVEAVIEKESLEKNENWKSFNTDNRFLLKNKGSYLALKTLRFPETFFENRNGKLTTGYKYPNKEFALSITINKSKVSVKTDDSGALPLFYYLDNKIIFISSSFTNLIYLINKRVRLPDIDMEALVFFIDSKEPLNDRTLLNGVRILYENSKLIFDKNGIRFERTVNSPLKTRTSNRTLNELKIIKKFSAVLDKSFYRFGDIFKDKRLVFGSALSGGSDSSVISQRLMSILGIKIDLFSIILPKPDSIVQIKRLKDFIDKFGGILNAVESEKYKTFFSDKPKTLHNPYSEVYYLPTYEVAKRAAKKGMAVYFTGFGGDELFKIRNTITKRIDSENSHVPYTTKFNSILKNVSLKKDFMNIFQSVRMSQLVYNHIFHEFGCWIISPFNYVPLIFNVADISDELKKGKRLLKLYQKYVGFPASYVESENKDSFISLYCSWLRFFYTRKLKPLMRNSVLERLGLLDTERLIKMLKTDSFDYFEKASLCRYLYSIISAELFLQNYLSLRRLRDFNQDT